MNIVSSLTKSISLVCRPHPFCTYSLLRNFHSESPSNEPGFLLIDKFRAGHFVTAATHSNKEYASFVTKTSTVLRLQNQEVPNIKTSLIHQQQNVRPIQGDFSLTLNSVLMSRLQKDLNGSMFKLIGTLDAAGSVFKHRRRKMNKHKYKKRMRAQRLKAPKNQTFKPYIPTKKESK